MPKNKPIHYNPKGDRVDTACRIPLHGQVYDANPDHVTCGNCKRTQVFREGKTKLKG